MELYDLCFFIESGISGELVELSKVRMKVTISLLKVGELRLSGRFTIRVTVSCLKEGSQLAKSYNIII
jgi:hypothetical protein